MNAEILADRFENSAYHWAGTDLLRETDSSSSPCVLGHQKNTTSSGANLPARFARPLSSTLGRYVRRVGRRSLLPVTQLPKMLLPRHCGSAVRLLDRSTVYLLVSSSVKFPEHSQIIVRQSKARGVWGRWACEKLSIIPCCSVLHSLNGQSAHTAKRLKVGCVRVIVGRRCHQPHDDIGSNCGQSWRRVGSVEVIKIERVCFVAREAIAHICKSQHVHYCNTQKTTIRSFRNR